MRWRQGPPLNRAEATDTLFARPAPAQNHILLGFVELCQRIRQMHRVASNASRVPDQPRIQRNNWLARHRGGREVRGLVDNVGRLYGGASIRQTLDSSGSSSRDRIRNSWLGAPPTAAPRSSG